MDTETRIVSATRDIDAPAERVFELIADPSKQPLWDGNDNVAEVVRADRIRAVGDVFSMRTTKDKVRDNHVVDFEEGRRVAWRPGPEGGEPVGHEWRWELQPQGADRVTVTHTYDWTELTDEARFERARWTTAERLQASIDRLAEIAEGQA